MKMKHYSSMNSSENSQSMPATSLALSSLFRENKGQTGNEMQNAESWKCVLATLPQQVIPVVLFTHAVGALLNLPCQDRGRRSITVHLRNWISGAGAIDDQKDKSRIYALTNIYSKRCVELSTDSELSFSQGYSLENRRSRHAPPSFDELTSLP